MIKWMIANAYLRIEIRKEINDMTQMKTRNQQETCPSCGAPVVSEICPYCGTPTGIDTAKADMEYPVIDCKEAELNFWNVWFPAIFAVGFGLAGLITLIVTINSGEGIATKLICLPFLLVGIVASILVIRVIVRYVKVKSRGKKMKATVYGYMNDDVLINNRPAQIVKLLVQTKNGPRFILYQLGNTTKTYGVNDELNIVVYKDCFMIDKSEENIF